jgi:hypothetical protein
VDVDKVTGKKLFFVPLRVLCTEKGKNDKQEVAISRH